MLLITMSSAYVRICHFQSVVLIRRFSVLLSFATYGILIRLLFIALRIGVGPGYLFIQCASFVLWTSLYSFWLQSAMATLFVCVNYKWLGRSASVRFSLSCKGIIRWSASLCDTCYLWLNMQIYVSFAERISNVNILCI